MWAAIHRSTNVLRMIFGTARRRIHRSPATRPVTLGTEKKTPCVSSSAGQPQRPACIQRVFYRFPNVLVWVIGHAGIILPSRRFEIPSA